MPIRLLPLQLFLAVLSLLLTARACSADANNGVSDIDDHSTHRSIIIMATGATTIWYYTTGNQHPHTTIGGGYALQTST
jgi:hypothetical protein